MTSRSFMLASQLTSRISRSWFLLNLWKPFLDSFVILEAHGISIFLCLTWVFNIFKAKIGTFHISFLYYNIVTMFHKYILTFSCMDLGSNKKYYVPHIIISPHKTSSHYEQNMTTRKHLNKRAVLISRAISIIPTPIQGLPQK